MTMEPIAAQILYSFFSAVMQQDIAAMDRLMRASRLTIDCLHPLRRLTALTEATRLGRTRACTWLLERGAAPGLLCGIKPTTALHQAIAGRHVALAEAMLATMETAHLVDYHGASPLHLLAQYADLASEDAWLRLAGALIDKQVRLEALDHEGVTALHYALIHERADLVELLLARGANPNAMALDTGMSPLLMAALNQQRDMVRLLLRYGANPDLPSVSGKTAAALMPDIERMLSEKSPARSAATISPTALL